MKKISIIMLAILSLGCVADKKETPVLDDGELIGCPDMIRQSAFFLNSFGLNEEQVQVWMENALSSEIQPCNECERLNEAAMLLQDKKGIYKNAMAKLINAVETVNPDSELVTEKQVKKVNSLLSEDVDNDDSYMLAGKYIDSLDLLEDFMVRQMRIPPEETKNFTLDKFIIPLMENNSKKQEQTSQTNTD